MTTTPALTDPYAVPAVYDILHTPGTAGEVDLLERLAERFGAPGGKRRRWLEPACGTGRYLRVLAGRGRRAAGFDLDEGMLDYAHRSLRRRRTNRRVRLVRADMTAFADHFEPASFDVAFVLVNSFRHLLRPSDVETHLGEMAAVLRPGGLYVVGISLSLYGEEDPSEDEWIGRRGSCTVRQLVQYLPPGRGTRRETVISHVEIERPRGIEVLDSTYALRSYDETQWRAALRGTDFERAASVDDRGRTLGDHPLDYQLEILRRT